MVDYLLLKHCIHIPEAIKKKKNHDFGLLFVFVLFIYFEFLVHAVFWGWIFLPTLHYSNSSQTSIAGFLGDSGSNQVENPY